MTIKSIFKIHPFFYIFTLITALTGNFKGYILFSSLIIIHEIGHLTMAIIFKWKIEKVIIMPFGGITIFKEDLNKSLIEELLILINGPLFQIIFAYLINNNELTNYSNNLLLFNMMPIIPLDGSKLINIILNKYISFKKSHLITIYISLLTITTIIIKLKFNLLIILIFTFIIFKIIEEIKNHNNIFNRFLLERYIKKFNFKKTKIIKSLKINKMRKGYKHIFYHNKKYLTEREILKKRFDFTNKTW